MSRIPDWLTHSRLGVDREDFKTLISEVLASQDSDDDVSFMSRSTLVDEACKLVSKHAKLRAIITQNGRPSEAPLGIVTAWDVAASET